MAHPRTEIRHAAIALLTAANTAAGARVSNTRVDPNRKGQVPALSVYTLGEESEVASTSPRELKREVQLEIVGWVANTDPGALADAMDALALEIEEAMDADRHLDGTATESVLEGTRTRVLEENGRSDPLVGEIVLTYSVTYMTSPATTALDEFLRVRAQHRIPEAVADNEAGDLFPVRSA